MGFMDATFTYRQRILCLSQPGYGPGHLAESVSLLVVLSTDETPIGIVTLHDVVRLQGQVTDTM